MENASLTLEVVYWKLLLLKLVKPASVLMAKQYFFHVRLELAGGGENSVDCVAE